MRADSTAPPSLFRHSDFLKLWTGQTISLLGTQVSFIAIPLTAVTVLGANAFQAGLLSTFEFLPFLLVGLVAGVYVDRLPRRAVLIVADVGRVLTLGSIPVASALGHLTLLQLYVVGFLTGVLTVFFDVAYQSYLPALVEREQLVDGNGKLEFSRASTEIAGPGIGGVLVSAVGAPLAVVADAVSYVLSVATLLLIGRREPRALRAQTRPGMRVELGEGLRYVLHHRVLRRVAACTGISNFFAHMAMAIVILYVVRELGFGAATIGLWFALGSVGAPLAAMAVGRLAARRGTGPTIVLSAWAGSGAFLLIPLAPHGAGALPVLIASGIIGSFWGVIYNVTQVSLRQAITPQRLQGRMNATMRFLVWGTIPLGALAGGILGSLIGLRPTLWVAGIGATLAGLPVTSRVVWRLRRMDDGLPHSAAAIATAALAPPSGIAGPLAGGAGLTADQL